jgi:DNA repair exonuclease SbcCD ATPase subunit
METIEKDMSVASDERIQNLIAEANNELTKIQPEIVYLEQCQKKLSELNEQKFKLNSLIVSLKSLIRNSDVNKNELNKNNLEQDNNIENNVKIAVNISRENNENSRKIFLPDQAISHVKSYLRIKNNLNYEIYKAIVFSSGKATTAEIKEYLVENKIKQPQSGKGFEEVELKEISSRVNYLVRKGVLISPEPGTFRSVFGWTDVC